MFIFIHSIILVSLIIDVLSLEIFQKYGFIENIKGKVLFNCTEFSKGDKMHFKINKSFESKLLYYDYYSSIEINETLLKHYPSHSVEKKAISNKEDQERGATHYFNIKKKEEEFDGSNGNYLLLMIDEDQFSNFENTEKDESSKAIFFTILYVLFGFIGTIAIIAFICWCIFGKKNYETSRCDEQNEGRIGVVYVYRETVITSQRI